MLMVYCTYTVRVPDCDVIAVCLCRPVHRGVGEIVFPRRTFFAGRLFHDSSFVRRHLSQPQLARSAFTTFS